MTHDDVEGLIAQAAGVVRPKRAGKRLFGDVGCALRTSRGIVYLGVCIDTPSGTGFCAEHSAIAAMVTAGETRIERIVAVWKDDQGARKILPPCGRCREFIRQIDEANLDCEVILGADNVVRLRELLPCHEWPGELAGVGGRSFAELKLRRYDAQRDRDGSRRHARADRSEDLSLREWSSIVGIDSLSTHT